MSLVERLGDRGPVGQSTQLVGKATSISGLVFKDAFELLHDLEHSLGEVVGNMRRRWGRSSEERVVGGLDKTNHLLNILALDLGDLNVLDLELKALNRGLRRVLNAT